MTKRIDIEALLRWAYRDELPKEQAATGLLVAGFGAAWGGIERYGELLTLVDASENRWGVVPDFTATVGPHPDAIRVGEAVAALDDLTLDLPEDWNPLGDCVALGDEAARAIARALHGGTTIDRDGHRRMKSAPRQLIRRYAVLGGTPAWQADAFERKEVCGGNGKPKYFRRAVVLVDPGDHDQGIPARYEEREIDGMDPKRRIPQPDAYTKTYYDPDPADVVLTRAEYEVWRAALDVLAIDLEGQLTDHEVIHSARPWRPWESGDLAPQRVLADLTRPDQRLRLWQGSWSIVAPA